jgi:hypothetical protein
MAEEPFAVGALSRPKQGFDSPWERQQFQVLTPFLALLVRRFSNFSPTDNSQKKSKKILCQLTQRTQSTFGSKPGGHIKMQEALLRPASATSLADARSEARTLVEWFKNQQDLSFKRTRPKFFPHSTTTLNASSVFLLGPRESPCAFSAIQEFHSDPIGGDGIIVDSKTRETWPTERVLVPMPRTLSVPDIEVSIAKAVSDKQKKGGAAYADPRCLSDLWRRRMEADPVCQEPATA